MRLRWALVWLVVLGVVPLLLFAGGVVFLYVRHERATVEQGFRETARALSLAVDRELASSITALEGLATSRDLDAGDLRGFHESAMRVLRSRPEWAGWNLADPSGRQVLNSRRPFGAALPEIADRPSHAEVLRTSRPAVGDLTRSAVSADTVLAVRVPVLRAGQVRYVLGAALRPEALNELFSAQRVPADWTAAILDGRQVIIARSRTPERFIGERATAKLAAATAAMPEGTFWDVTKEGVPAFGAFSRSSLSGWTVVLGIPAETVQGAVRWSLGLLLMGGAAVLVMGMAIATVIGRRIEVSIASLSDSMRLVGHGEHPGAPRISRIHELAALARDIIAAGATLQQRTAQRASAESALRAQTEMLEIINRTGRLLSAELDQQTVVQAVTDAATRLSGAAFGAFFYNVLDERGERYMLYTLSGAPRESFASFPMPRNTELFGPTFRGEATVRIDDVIKDPRYGRSAPFHGMPSGHLPVRSYLAVPVVSRTGEVLGGLFLGHPEVGVFGERAEQLVTGIAAQAAIAVDNARLYERQERARAQAEEANRSKDEFLAVLSHELRTPLNAILGWVRMLRVGQVDADGVHRALEVIERNARAQVQLVEDLLDVSRVITGNMRLEVRALYPHTVIEATIESIRPAAEAKAVRVQSVLDPKAGPVAGDPHRLQQIMWNLLSNAVRFTDKGGRIQIRLERVDSHVEIIVSDTGEGIAPDVLPYVFDRFRQGESGTTRRHGGLGLGLALVKHLVEAHGGTVHAQSPGVGRGATFTVKLPLLVHQDAALQDRVHPAARDVRPPQEADGLAGVRLLVVDDDQDARELFTAMLQRAGAEVRVAASTDTALEMLRQWRPDALLSDIEMPGRDGYTLIRELRSEGTGQPRLPAIAVTAYGSVDDRVRALWAGFDAYLAKPVDAAELIAVVRSLLARTPGSTDGA